MLRQSRYRIYTPDHHHNDILNQFATIDSVFDHEASILSQGDQSEVFKHEIGQQAYFIKRYYRSRGLLSWFGYCRFNTEVRNQRWFNQINIPSATLISSAEQKRLFKTTKGFLITQGLHNTKDLAAIARDTPAFFSNVKRNEQLVTTIALILRQLHAHKFCHNDLHWRNLLVDDNSNKINVYLIDCPSGHFLRGPMFRYKQIKDIANLDKQAPSFFSRTQRLRFFLSYRGNKKLTQLDKQLITAVLRHKAHRQIRKEKSGLALLFHQIKFNLFQH